MTAAASAWMPLYVADYLRDTMHLSTELHGAYLLLIMAAWSRGGTLPNDPAQLAGMAKMSPAAWRRASAVILPFFKATGQTLAHKRIVEEFEKAQRLSETRRQNGGKGGRPRKLEVTGEKPTGFENPPFSKANAKLSETPTRVALPSPSPHPSDGSEGKEPSAQIDVVDPDGTAWRMAKLLLEERANLSPEAAGRFFGKLLSEHGLEARDLFSAVAEANANATQDPKAFLTKAAQNRAKRRAEPQLSPAEKTLRSNIQ